MRREAEQVRAGKPLVMTNASKGDGIDEIVAILDRQVLLGA